jgi:glycosyltransferase involved in cell wall biosynthesis
MANLETNILMIAPFFYPHLGGVEKHVFEVAKIMQQKGAGVEIIAPAHQPDLEKKEQVQGISVNRFFYPQRKFLGLVMIWVKMLGFGHLVRSADVIHVHDVMIWYLPLRLLFPKKKVVLTAHGWEGTYPLPKKNIWLKRLSASLANRVVCVGEYIGKHYSIECDHVVYGGVNSIFAGKRKAAKQDRKKIVYLGRLAPDTGLEIFLESLAGLKDEFDFIFLGDGELRGACERYGQVNGWLGEESLAERLKKADIVIVGGYLSALEALAAGCRVIAAADNPLKKDYWLQSELGDLVEVVVSSKELAEKIVSYRPAKHDASAISERFSWNKLAEAYLSLYQSI